MRCWKRKVFFSVVFFTSFWPFFAVLVRRLKNSLRSPICVLRSKLFEIRHAEMESISRRGMRNILAPHISIVNVPFICFWRCFFPHFLFTTSVFALDWRFTFFFVVGGWYCCYTPTFSVLSLSIRGRLFSFIFASYPVSWFRKKKFAVHSHSWNQKRQCLKKL